MSLQVCDFYPVDGSQVLTSEQINTMYESRMQQELANQNLYTGLALSVVASLLIGIALGRLFK